MKKIVIIVAGLSLVFLGYILGSRPNITDGDADERSEKATEVHQNKISKSVVEPVVLIREEEEEQKDLLEIYKDIDVALDNPNGREILKASMGILKLSAAELEELLKNSKLSEMKTSDYAHSEILSACFARLTEIDPQHAIRLTALIDRKLQERAMTSIFREWALSDPDAALAASLENTDPLFKKNALIQTINAITESDPTRAFELALKHDSAQSSLYETFSHILLKMAGTDPLLALKKSGEVPLKGIRAGQERDARERGIMSAWSKDDPKAALEHILQSEGDSDKALFTLDLVRRFTSNDPEKAFELLAAGKSVISGSRLEVALQGLAKKDPKRALSWITETYSGEQKDDLLRSSISSWYAEDESAVFAYFNEIQDPELKKVVSSGMLSRFRYSDPDKFLALYPEMNSGSIYDKKAFGVTIRNLAFENPTEAKRYLDSLSDPELRSQALAPYLMGLMRSDPDQSFEIVEQVQDGAEKEALKGSVYPLLALNKPSLVADDFSKNGFQNLGSYKFEDFISTYASRDITQAAELVNTMENSELRDTAIQSIIPQFSHQNTAFSLEWANSISNPETRLNTMKSSYDNWRKLEPEQASEWLQSTELLEQSTKSDWEQ